MQPRVIVQIGLPVLVSLVALPTFGQPLGTALTYQGRLDNSGTPANGLHDMQFQLFTALSGGSPVGSAICRDGVNVVDGLFTVSLDFGAAYDGNQRFLAVGVRPDSTAGNCASGAYTALSPRQALTAAPYALKVPGVDGHSLDAVDGSPVDAVFVNASGNVGIGTAAPQSPLHLMAPNTGPLPGEGLRIQGTLTSVANQAYASFLNGAGTAIGYVGDGSTGDNNVFLASYIGDVTLGTPAGRVLNATAGGNVGIGTAAPADKLHVVGNVRADGALRSYHSSGAAEVFLGWGLDAQGADVARIRLGGGGPAYNGLDIQGIGNVSLMRIRGDGTAVVRVLEITGADLAEKFPASEKLEPGMVVAIDPANAGQLCLARGAYNPSVAGVVSGANDFKVGAVLGNLPGHEEAPAIALSGRVYVWCDASTAAIEPGNLLTTSDTPGHAMKAVDRERSHGAVIGKAMTALACGERGMVLVLANLQ